MKYLSQRIFRNKIYSPVVTNDPPADWRIPKATWSRFVLETVICREFAFSPKMKLMFVPTRFSDMVVFEQKYSLSGNQISLTCF
jgi:hypothetical protein